jgi:hypothetical protein
MEEVFKIYNSLKIICSRAKDEAIRNPNTSVFKEIIPTGKIRKDKKESINEYFDSLQQKITELCISDMITVFERKIFIRVDNEL